MYGGDITVHQEIRELYRKEFLLCAAEKQIPMPPKVYKSCDTTEIWPAGHKVIIWDKGLECQNCGARFNLYCRDTRVKYCPLCGQKLWLPE